MKNIILNILYIWESVAKGEVCGITDPDDQHFLDLASAHQALLVSKDNAVLKQRKRVATHYGATVGNVVVLEAVESTAAEAATA